MPWKETDVRSQRIGFVVRALHPGRNMSRLCRDFGISRKTGYKWLRRHAQVGSLAELDEHSRRPHYSPHQTVEAVEERVIGLRLEQGWGGRKISRILRSQGIRVARSTADRILKRRGLIEPHERHRPATQRFERSEPNELVQMDFKGQYQLAGGRMCYPLSILDDHSRYALGVFALSSQHGKKVQRYLIQCFEHYGVPEGMLMDHGNPWWGTTNGHGLTRLSVFLIKQGIDLHHGRIRHPQTQGKVERFHRTLGQALAHRGLPTTLPGFQIAFDSFRAIYNEVRPHESLGDEVPASRYQPSRKVYQPVPAEWEYPAGSQVERIADNGCLCLQGRYTFVCHALAGERVLCQRFGDMMLVTYRHMHVREIDLETGRTTAVVRPEGQKKVLPMS